MELSTLGAEGHEALQKILGYLNFSTGPSDPQFLASVNTIYGALTAQRDDRKRGGEADSPSTDAIWRVVGRLLAEQLHQLQTEVSAFTDSRQASAVLDLVTEHAIPGYRQFHRDLLIHQPDDILFGPFMVGRICEAVLRQGPPWEETDRICTDAITALNDYIGHRPVAALETRKLEPYAHEWTRPIPLYVEGAGVAVGPYHDLIERTLWWLQRTDQELLQEAWFDLANLEEMAVDGRAYDFDHPVNKRPNYHFGQWDPHCIDNRGYYRRYVLQQVTLDALMERVENAKGLPRSQLLDEAAAVLGGTILMAAGVSGRGPDTHDSTTNLATLLPRIAAYRDRYYELLVDHFPSKHASRLRAEAAKLRQPLGGARQHLNTQLARCRASQLQRVYLAIVFARMGYPDAARHQAHAVPVASSRMMCQIDCDLTSGQQAIETGDLETAAGKLEDIMDLLRRAIECGAVVDPWNILGFDANFSLFPAMENSVRDHRVDGLIEMVDRTFALYAGIWSEAAAANNQAVCERIAARFEKAAGWWHQYAAHEVQSVETTSAVDTFQAARNVAEALRLWHQAGAAAGNIAFWAPHAEVFKSPKSFVLVIEKLLERDDFVTSMALLMHWLSRADDVPVEQSSLSFCRLTRQWLLTLLYDRGRGIDTRDRRQSVVDAPSDRTEAESTPGENDERWSIVRKFFDYLEANADQYWSVPQFELGGRASRPNHRHEANIEEQTGLDQSEEEDLKSDELFRAAYEDVVYRDSTDDGVDGTLFEFDPTSEDELDAESERIANRLAFLHNLARLWTMAALAWPRGDCGVKTDDDPLHRWYTRASANREQLMELLTAIDNYTVPAPLGDHDSMLQYNRKRVVREALLDQAVQTCVETSDAVRSIVVAARLQYGGQTNGWSQAAFEGLPEEEQHAVEVMHALLRGEVRETRASCRDFAGSLRKKPLLHLPSARGGTPKDIVSVQARRRAIDRLVAWLPRVGLLSETRQLIDIARKMERNVPVGPGAVTHFDELFETGYRGMVETVVRAAELAEQAAPAASEGQPREEEENESSDAEESFESEFVECLEQLTESLLIMWLDHSRTLRLSVLEKVSDPDRWKQLVAFVERYGADIFTQRFMNLANLRAISQQGVDAWLWQLRENVPEASQWQLLQDLDSGIIDRREAAERLSLIVEAIAENYVEYCDYNSTTTQSDRGDMLFTLLDFLRLRVSYDRVVWNLRPVILTHEILVRNGRPEAAQLWRRALTERISDEADRYQSKLARLQKKYAMRMATVSDRLGERFLRTMTIDRMRALVEPAMRVSDSREANHAFEILEGETGLLMRHPSGSGHDLPIWLIALEEEVDRALGEAAEVDETAQLAVILPQVPIRWEEVKGQVQQW